MTVAPDDILDDPFHAIAFAAFVQEARRVSGWPESNAVKRTAYKLYEEELAKPRGAAEANPAPSA